MTPMQEPSQGVERLTGFEDTIGDMQELAHGDNNHRLLARGKRPMQVVVAAMRKLLHLAFGVLKSGKPFNPKLGVA